MARRYRVILPVGNYSAGDELSASDGEFAYEALVQSGHLEQMEDSVLCPACSESESVKKKDVPRFQKQETMAEHYRKEHPALAAPDFEEVV